MNLATNMAFASRRQKAKPTTIVYIIFALSVAGAEIVLLELVKGLDRSRFRPVIISLAPRAALSDAFEADGVEIHHLGMRRIEQAPLIMFRAWRLVRELRPALLHGFMFYGDLTARLLRMFDGTPRVITAMHNTSIGPRRFERVMQWSDRYTDAVTAVSNAVARAQVAAGSVPRNKVTVIHNGIDLKRMAAPSASELGQLRAHLGLKEGNRVLLCVGRLEPVKDHALLLRAFQTLSGRVDDLTLLIVGRGRLEEDLRALAVQLGIADRVCFAGEISRIGPMFHLADLFVLSSWREGLPLVVLEAMAAQLPMVLTTVGGIPEVVEHEKSGILIPPRNEAALTAALERVLRMSPEERLALGSAARRSVEDRFQVAHMVAAHEDLYDRVLGRGSAAI